MVTVITRPGSYTLSASNIAPKELVDSSSMASMISPGFMPALSAGPEGVTEVTNNPLPSSTSKRGSKRFCDSCHGNHGHAQVVACRVALLDDLSNDWQRNVDGHRHVQPCIETVA